ncbi:MAG: class I SAM-dependent methyltransferase [Ignavibacteriales bacterium]|nr:class I SAM-dependent methyltransferase [Ignavibacteriales bacterium]
MDRTKFYDGVSGFYDKMIDFEKNLNLRIDAYKTIFPAYGNIVDIGCGVGLDSIALAKNGHAVTAFDISPQMIGMVKVNSEKYDVKIKTGVFAFNTIPKSYHGKFNNAVSVGNTIAHLTKKELLSGFKKIYALLKPGGKVFLHILNYTAIIKMKKRINNIANRDGSVIIRFYDFENEHVQFNILSFPLNNPKEFDLYTTNHYPHTKKEIETALRSAGFSKVKSAGDFYGNKFSVRDSKDLFIEAHRLE